MWKAPWRWFSEEMFDCCVSLETAKQVGITLEQFWCLAKCNGADVKLMRYCKSSEDEFRKYVIEATSRGNYHVVSSFSRAALGQTGDGHFSPIGGYHKEKDLVLLMDVARFKYPSYWLPVSTLWQAMGQLDATTEKPRGYLLMKASNRVSVLYKIFYQAHKMTLRNLTFELMRYMPTLISEYQAYSHCYQAHEQPNNEDSSRAIRTHVHGFSLEHVKLANIIRVLFQNLPKHVKEALVSYCYILQVEATNCTEHRDTIANLITELRSMKLYTCVQRVFMPYATSNSNVLDQFGNQIVQHDHHDHANCNHSKGDCNHAQAIEQASKGVVAQVNSSAPSSGPANSNVFLQREYAAELATLLLLTLPMQAFHSLDASLQSELRHLREPLEVSSPAASSGMGQSSTIQRQLLQEELSKLRFQLKQLCDSCGTECTIEDDVFENNHTAQQAQQVMQHAKVCSEQECASCNGNSKPNKE